VAFAANGESNGPVTNGDKQTDGANKTGDMEDAEGSPDSYGSLFGDEEEEEGGAKKQEKPKPAEPAPVVPSAQPSKLLPSLVTAVSAPSSRPGILSAGLKGQPRVGLPPLAPETYRQFSDDVMLVASMDGEVALHDKRIESTLVGKLEGSLKSGPWCMSASRLISALHPQCNRNLTISFRRHASRQMELRSSRGVGMPRWTSGTSGKAEPAERPRHRIY
jgi:hypothetical protein